MKKALLYGLSAVMLLSLTACGTARAEQPDPVQSPGQSKGIEGYITQSSQDEGEVGVIDDEGSGEVAKEVSSEELYKIFELGYQNGQDYKELGLDGEDLIIMEITEVQYIFEGRIDITAPLDLEEQYRAWRAENHQDASAQAEVQLFIECNEVVYAVDQVNIRASYTVNSNKLGSLSRGQSITRIGNGIQGTEAEGWSKVQLSDGTIAYMVSSYLSTTKPTTQTKPGGTTHKPPNTGTQTPGTPDNTPQSPGSYPPGYDPNFNPSGGNPVIIHPDDPWEGQPELDLGN